MTAEREHLARCAKRLRVTLPVTVDDLKSAFRVAARETHPDHGGNQHDFIEARRAYDYLLQHCSSAQTARPEPEPPAKDHRKNFGPCPRCNGTGKAEGGWWSNYCPKCGGSGEVELFNPVLVKMRMTDNRPQSERKSRRPKRERPKTGRFVRKSYL